MAEWKRISPLDIVWQGFGRVEGGGMVAVLKCRVSINGEMSEGREDGCRSAPSDNGVFAGGGGGRGSEREQSASWGRDIAVSNKQTTDTYKYIGPHGAILKYTQCGRQSGV